MWALDDHAQAATRGKAAGARGRPGLSIARMREMVLSIVLALKFSVRDRNAVVKRLAGSGEEP
jgi:hypothetical protein